MCAFCVAMQGMFRLVKYLSEDHLLGKKSRVKFVVDAGTGTSAVGLGVAAMSLGLGLCSIRLICVCFFFPALMFTLLLRLPWEVNAVMLADTLDNYKKHQERLLDEFTRQFLPSIVCSRLDTIKWVERQRPRKYDSFLC